MKEALEKILKNYVLRNVELSRYDIQIFPTPENNKKYYQEFIFS